MSMTTYSRDLEHPWFNDKYPSMTNAEEECQSRVGLPSRRGERSLSESKEVEIEETELDCWWVVIVGEGLTKSCLSWAMSYWMPHLSFFFQFSRDPCWFARRNSQYLAPGMCQSFEHNYSAERRNLLEICVVFPMCFTWECISSTFRHHSHT
jgi:hypothetical protein